MKKTWRIVLIIFIVAFSFIAKQKDFPRLTGPRDYVRYGMCGDGLQRVPLGQGILLSRSAAPHLMLSPRGSIGGGVQVYMGGE